MIVGESALRTLGWVRSAEWPTDGWPCPVLDCQLCELALPLVPWLAGRVLGGLGPLLLRVSGSHRSPGDPRVRTRPACPSHASWRAIKRGSEAVSTRDANSHALIPSPSFDSRPLPSARYVLPELLLLRTQDLCAPSHNGARMPKLGGARGAGTRLKGALSVRLAGPLAAGREPLEDGLFDLFAACLRPFAVRRWALALPRSAPVRVGVLLGSRARCGCGRGAWETRTS